MARGTMQHDRAPALKRVSYSNAAVQAAEAKVGSALSGSMVRFFTNCGVMKFAVDGAIGGIR